MLENCYNNDLSSNEDINYQKPTKHLVLPSQSYEYQNPSKFITEGKFVKNFAEDPLFSIQNFSPLYKEGKPIVIGTGTFSTVFLYKNNYSNKYYAVKYMKKKKIIETCATLESVYKEISIQSKITHENIVKLYSSNEKEKDFSEIILLFLLHVYALKPYGRLPLPFFCENRVPFFSVISLADRFFS